MCIMEVQAIHQYHPSIGIWWARSRCFTADLRIPSVFLVVNGYDQYKIGDLKNKDFIAVVWHYVLKLVSSVFEI